MNNCCWCRNELISSKRKCCQLELNEKHNLCSYCHLTGHACQSSCPLCWYNLAEKYFKKTHLCSGCFENLNDNSSRLDEHNHQLCNYCFECILCSFRLQTKKEFFYLSYRQHDYRIQKILYQMQNCVQKIEDDYELCSICMEILNDQNSIEILQECKHRFHQICIEKWFKEKPCCPCCRQIYQIHYQPKSKRMRGESSTISINSNQ